MIIWSDFCMGQYRDVAAHFMFYLHDQFRSNIYIFKLEVEQIDFVDSSYKLTFNCSLL